MRFDVTVVDGIKRIPMPDVDVNIEADQVTISGFSTIEEYRYLYYPVIITNGNCLTIIGHLSLRRVDFNCLIPNN